MSPRSGPHSYQLVMIALNVHMEILGGGGDWAANEKHQLEKDTISSHPIEVGLESSGCSNTPGGSSMGADCVKGEADP